MEGSGIMTDEIEVRITMGGLEAVRITQPLNPKALLVGDLDVTLEGWAIDDFGGIPADTKFNWTPCAPIVIPKEAEVYEPPEIAAFGG